MNLKTLDEVKPGDVLWCYETQSANATFVLPVSVPESYRRFLGYSDSIRCLTLLESHKKIDDSIFIVIDAVEQRNVYFANTIAKHDAFIFKLPKACYKLNKIDALLCYETT